MTINVTNDLKAALKIKFQNSLIQGFWIFYNIFLLACKETTK